MLDDPRDIKDYTVLLGSTKDIRLYVFFIPFITPPYTSRHSSIFFTEILSDKQ
jgi:hypothetical protein